MKIIIVGLLSGLSLLGTQVSHALECTVTYKAKRIVTKQYLFRKVSNPEYKAGLKRGHGKTIQECKKNALQPLKDKGWEIHYTKVNIVE